MATTKFDKLADAILSGLKEEEGEGTGGGPIGTADVFGSGPIGSATNSIMPFMFGSVQKRGSLYTASTKRRKKKKII